MSSAIALAREIFSAFLEGAPPMSLEMQEMIPWCFLLLDND